jgi:hypothetical protein
MARRPKMEDENFPWHAEFTGVPIFFLFLLPEKLLYIVCARVRVCVCVRACVYVRARVCVCVCFVCVRA